MEIFSRRNITKTIFKKLYFILKNNTIFYFILQVNYFILNLYMLKLVISGL